MSTSKTNNGDPLKDPPKNPAQGQKLKRKDTKGTNTKGTDTKGTSETQDGIQLTQLPVVPQGPWAPAITDALTNKSEIVVKSLQSFKGGKFQVLDSGKSVLFQVKRERDPDQHCDCYSKCCKKKTGGDDDDDDDDDEEEDDICTKYCDVFEHPMTIYARAIAGHEVLVAQKRLESQTCFLRNWTIEVKLRPDIQIGSISNSNSWQRFVLTNPSGDRLLTVKKEQSCFEDPVYKVYSLDETQVGEIHIEKSKTRLVFMKQIALKSKILLLIFTISIQCNQEQRSRNRSHQNQQPY